MTNTMNYGGYIVPSTVDWFGVSTGILFFRGCVLNCRNCQNVSLLRGKSKVTLDSVKREIEDSEFLISGVVFSGGEPCLQVDVLSDLIDWCKTRKLKSYLHTSGAYPGELRQVIKRLDGVRIDFKPMEQFSTKKTSYTDKFARYTEEFTESILEVIEPSGIDYWVTAVALNDNHSLSDVYQVLCTDPKRLLIVQGNEECPKTADELEEEFHNCYLYTKERGLKWNE